MPSSPSAIVLLGAQRFDPTLGAAVAKQFVTQKVALITAGWQELESEDDDLRAHLAPRETVNLMLHARGEELFREDPELRAAHRERQDALRHRQDFYRIRVEHALEAERVIRKRPAPPEIAEEQCHASTNAIRELDAWHLASCAREHAAFEERWSLKARPSVARHRREVAGIVKGCAAIAIAGGHVASLINRLFLFGIDEIVGGKFVFAWSGGAMAVSERVVLFHDDPPQGPGASEVLDAGLGLVPGVVVLPQPEQRLDLSRRDRVQSMVRRFAPARCLALPARSSVVWRAGAFAAADGAVELREDGGHGPFAAGGPSP
jgi:hypothetical protein